MIRNKLSFERQVDERLYQALVPHDGNWIEASAFSQEFAKYCADQLEVTNKMMAEQKAKEVLEPVVEDFKPE